MPTLAASYAVYSPGTDTSTLVTPLFTPNNGDVLVVKAATYDTANGMAAPTGGAQTYQQVAIANPAGFFAWNGLWVATVSGSPGSMSVSCAPATATITRHSMVVERWTNAKLAVSPATNAITSSGTAGLPQASLTTVGNNSAISWCSTDDNSNSPATRAYLLSATEDGLFDGSVGANSVQYFAYAVGASVGAAGAYTIGMSAPTNQKWTMIGVEVQDNTPASGITMLGRRFKRVANKTQFTVSGVGTSAVWDANDYYANIGFDVTQAGVTSWSVQLQGSIDNVNFFNIGLPTTSTHQIGTTIGPVTQATDQTCFWGNGAYRYFRLSTTVLNAGTLTVNLAVA